MEIIKEIEMADKEKIQAMLEKVVRGTESRNELIEVFTSMAADLGVEQKAPEPAPVPEPEPEPAPEEDENSSSFFGA
mgnify:CR=1 FL=1